MRKAMIISFLGVFLLVAKSEAQHFHFVNSIGVEHHWDLPHSVYDEIDYNYRGYDIIHAGNVWRNGFNYFDITLRRGNVFVQLEMGNRGRILSRNVTRSFPFNNHVCNNHCGFHNDFFVQNRAVCSTPYYSRYPNRPQSIVYVNPRPVYGKGNQWNGHNGKYKGKGKSERVNSENKGRASRTYSTRSNSGSSTTRSGRPTSTEVTSSQYKGRSRGN